MRDNCGIIALDTLIKSLNVKMNRISLYTLMNICKDNETLMFPLKVPKEELKQLEYPYILQNNNHYEVIEDELSLDGLILNDINFLLSPTLKEEYLANIDEIKEVKGAGEGGKAGNIPIIGPFISKPGRLLPLLGGAASSMLGLGPTMGNLISAGIGAGQGGTTGLWGQPGMGSMMKGGATGFGLGMLGRGVGTGLQNVFTPGQTLQAPGATMSIPNQGFLGGFKQGFGESVPFKNAINSLLGKQFFTPFDSLGVKEMQPAGGGMGVTPTQTGAGGILQNMAQNIANQGQTGQVGQQGGKSGFNLASVIPLLGSALFGNPEYNVPSAESEFQRLSSLGSSLPSTFTEEGAAAAKALLGNIQNPQDIYNLNTDEYMNAIDQNSKQGLDDTLNRIDVAFSNNGTYGGSDWQRARSEATIKYNTQANLQKGAVKQEIYKMRAGIYLDSISNAYQLDRQHLEIIAGLTNASINEAAYKYGLKVKEIADFRNALQEWATGINSGSQSYGSMNNTVK